MNAPDHKMDDECGICDKVFALHSSKTNACPSGEGGTPWLETVFRPQRVLTYGNDLLKCEGCGLGSLILRERRGKMLCSDCRGDGKF